MSSIPAASLADRLAVTELLYRYAELIDAGDFDGAGQLFGRCALGAPNSPKVTGATAITQLFAATIRRYPDGTPQTRHLVLNPIVEIASGEVATARSTFCVVQGTETVPLQPIVVGRYLDTFRRDDDGWYFATRDMDVELVGDVSGHLMVDPRTATPPS